MNHSICSADRATHLKIVVIALFLGTIVTGLSLFLHSSPKGPPAEKMTVLKARALMTATSTIVIVR
jgi:hypothetical protein